MPDLRRLVAPLLSLVATLTLLTAALPARASEPPAPRPVLTLPVPGSRIVELAALPVERWHAGHRGIDIAAAADGVVVSPGSGTVVFAGEVAGRGVMSIALDVGVTATLEPVVATVAAGDRVVRSQGVGIVTAMPGHCAPQTCVHWGIKHGEVYLDPLDWLVGFGPIVLLE